MLESFQIQRQRNAVAREAAKINDPIITRDYMRALWSLNSDSSETLISPSEAREKLEMFKNTPLPERLVNPQVQTIEIPTPAETIKAKNQIPDWLSKHIAESNLEKV